jgi:hypothetical protein
LALNSEIQTYEILTNDDEVCIPSLSSILLAVLLVLAKKMKQYNKGLQTTAVAILLHSSDHLPATARQTVSNLCPC